MKALYQPVILSAFGLMSLNICAQQRDSTSRVQVSGDDFVFSVKMPDGWIGDTATARQYKASIIFYKDKNDLTNGGALVQVYVFTKKDEMTDMDLRRDLRRYEDQYLTLQEDNLPVPHKEYKCYGKLVYVEGRFFEYIAYINPGKKYKSGFSVSMNIVNRRASNEELKAFKEIIASFIMLRGKGHLTKKWDHHPMHDFLAI